LDDEVLPPVCAAQDASGDTAGSTCPCTGALRTVCTSKVELFPTWLCVTHSQALSRPKFGSEASWFARELAPHVEQISLLAASTLKYCPAAHSIAVFVLVLVDVVVVLSVVTLVVLFVEELEFVVLVVVTHKPHCGPLASSVKLSCDNNSIDGTF
jgi:hypothetical protein